MVCETQSLFKELRQSVDAKAMDAIERLVVDAPDHKLCRINVLDFASKVGLDEERAIAAFLHATQLGLFELSWNVLCPACGGGIHTPTTPRALRPPGDLCLPPFAGSHTPPP